jgi:hypothetical protein
MIDKALIYSRNLSHYRGQLSALCVASYKGLLSEFTNQESAAKFLSLVEGEEITQGTISKGSKRTRERLRVAVGKMKARLCPVAAQYQAIGIWGYMPMYHDLCLVNGELVLFAGIVDTHGQVRYLNADGDLFTTSISNMELV